jgi:hypothetical protein
MNRLLDRYTQKAKTMSTGEMLFALHDIRQTLPNYLDCNPSEGYAAKLYAERDAYLAELQKRQRKVKV